MNHDDLIFDKSLYSKTVGFVWINHPEIINAINFKKVDELFPYMVRIDSYVIYLNCVDWCFENIKHGWSRFNFTMYFTDKADASLFKLFWI
jgi:hypothetical protein